MRHHHPFAYQLLTPFEILPSSIEDDVARTNRTDSSQAWLRSRTRPP